MSVSLTDVRFVIQDQPRSFGVAPESPRVMGVSDGSNKTYYLPLDDRQYVAGSATIYQTVNSVQTTIASSGYTITQQGVVSLTAATPNSAIMAAAFQATVFADADLTTVLSMNVTRYGDDDMARWGVQLDIIDILLTNPTKLARLREAEYEKDPAAVVNALDKLRASLQKKIESGIRPGRSAPVLFAAGPVIRDYQPRR